MDLDTSEEVNRACNLSGRDLGLENEENNNGSRARLFSLYSMTAEFDKKPSIAVHAEVTSSCAI